jgi:hypothetical protein
MDALFFLLPVAVVALAYAQPVSDKTQSLPRFSSCTR